MIAAELLKEQGISVEAVIFKSCFFDEEKGIKAAEQLKIPYRVIDISKELLKVVKKPKHGWGKAVNPCIDCHLLMLKQAKKILIKEGFNFIATGEVLGQRPFSQNKQSLGLIEEESGLSGTLLRPLSAKLLEPTTFEKKGIIDREKLWDICGRGRKKQENFAKKLGWTYSQPAGGCILCEQDFGRKFKEMLVKSTTRGSKKPKFTVNDAELLKIGRHFWQNKNKTILGRNERENNLLESLALPKDFLLNFPYCPSPTALVRGKTGLDAVYRAQQLILRYTKEKKKSNFQKEAIVFFGSSRESVLVLEKLLAQKIPIGAIITQPDRSVGRGQKLIPMPPAVFAKNHTISVFKWEKLDEEALERTKKELNFKPLLAVCAVYGNVIPQVWLNWCKGTVLNIHPSFLPKYRGGAPVVWPILNGEKQTGVTIFKLSSGWDAGPILWQEKITIGENETAGELTKRLFEIGAEKLTEILKEIYQSKKQVFFLFKPQDEKKASFALKKDLKSLSAEINWRWSPQQIHNFIRAFNLEPGAYTFINIRGRKLRLKIWRSHLEKGKLILDEVQLEGKNRVNWKQFKEAYQIKKLKG